MVFNFLKFKIHNHLGNLLAVVSDEKDANGKAIVLDKQDYYAFGSLNLYKTVPAATPETNSWASNYRYGFNGKENMKEAYSMGVLQDYGFRLYNSHIARFLSVDPLRHQYPELTTYQFAGNTPFQAIDLDGLEPLIVSKPSVTGVSTGMFFNINTTPRSTSYTPRSSFSPSDNVRQSALPKIKANTLSRNKIPIKNNEFQRLEYYKSAAAASFAAGSVYVGVGLCATGIGAPLGAAMIIAGVVTAGLCTGKAIVAASGGNTDQIPEGLGESLGMAGDGLYQGITGEKQSYGRLAGTWSDFAFGIISGYKAGKIAEKIPIPQLPKPIELANTGCDVFSGVENTAKTIETINQPKNDKPTTPPQN